jgi:hypothetical protein
MSDPRFNRKLVCHVHRIVYHYGKRVGILEMSEGDCCDMTACLDLFLGIDLEVERIHTYSGEKPDTMYCKRDGEWQSVKAPDDR